MDKNEAVYEAIKSLDPDDIGEKIENLAELTDAAITLLIMVALIGPTSKDEIAVKIITMFNSAFKPIVDKTTEFIEGLD